ncbi:hypothetical protein BOX15_Mlig016351g2 [Macrostomum lignano]|uniref:Calpain catalytic domain-containing protein n=2 Tax=Macrostomum lignano TaxID=282301 RepID=A0A267FRX5_9PLAT|nr:hypothetical protein BOX15_Mlig016351g2 [Macrostomum lignano]
MSDQHSSRLRQLEEDGRSLAKRAVEQDQAGSAGTASFFYTEAAQALLAAKEEGSQLPNLLATVRDYISRAEQLKAVSSTSAAQAKSQEQQQLDRARYLLSEALEDDESGQGADAIGKYVQAVEALLQLSKSAEPGLRQKCQDMAKQALERAEVLKKKSAAASAPPQLPSAPTDLPGDDVLAEPPPPPTSLTPQPRPTPPPAQQRPQPSRTEAYTKAEIAVLRATSRINGRNYLPFMASDAREQFAYPQPFTDSEGLLPLSAKQQRSLSRWARPDQLAPEPKMILLVSPMSITQTIVSDCSFVASMAVAAQYERRFKRQLVTNIIYPQNRRGEPVYNPCGKYMIKLHLNGVARKVIIDDQLPVARSGELIGAYSNNSAEFWVSFLEKAYMKVMGGYDFPGSNSNIDLHALTGWIPERIPIDEGNPVRFKKDKVFTKLQDRFHQGHCLITAATGPMSQADADRAGLVETHAYAVLDIRVAAGHRLLMLKNPWNHLSWNGNFSRRDTRNWTPELERLLNYDTKSARLYDNGVFWIDYDSLCRFFEVLYVSWSPDLFPHTSCLHDTWPAKEGPKKDRFCIADNPQYLLTVAAQRPCPVWVLLCRHIVDRRDFADNQEYIALVVYKGVSGRKIFYPSDPAPYKDGARVNSPLYLVQMVQESGTASYHLVVSQYEKNNTINYTIRVYCTEPFKLTKVPDPFVTEKSVSGEWKGASAGGCANHPDSYSRNPCYQVRLDNGYQDNQLLIELRGPRDYFTGFDLTQESGGQRFSSGSFRQGYSMLEKSQLPGGVYNIVPCTFKPGQEGPFILEVSASRPFTLSKVR